MKGARWAVWAGLLAGIAAGCGGADRPGDVYELTARIPAFDSAEELGLYLERQRAGARDSDIRRDWIADGSRVRVITVDGDGAKVDVEDGVPMIGHVAIEELKQAGTLVNRGHR